MIQRVLLVAWKGSTATQWVNSFADAGYSVLLEDTTGERAWRTAKERGIHLVVIDGQKKPSHGRQTGQMLRDTAKTRDIKIIWTNLDVEDETNVRNEVQPDELLVAPTDVKSALDAVRKHQPSRQHPIELGIIAPPNDPPPKPPSQSAIIPTPPKAVAKPKPSSAPTGGSKPAKSAKPAKVAVKSAARKPAKPVRARR